MGGDAEGVAACGLVDEVYAANDIAPLVRPPNLHAAVMTPEQFEEVVGLHQQIIEFEEGVGLLGGETTRDRILFHHCVDGEVHAHFAQHLEVAELAEPVVIIDHDGIGRTVAEGQEGLEGLLDAFHIGRNLLVGQQGARLFLVGRVAHLGCAAAHQDDGLPAALLEVAQHHDLEQRADMQAVCRRIKADIACGNSLCAIGVHLCRMGDLFQVTAL